MPTQFQAGQTVILLADRQPPREVVVEKVGRKLAYVNQYGRSVGYNAETGYQGGSYTGVANRIVTHEARAAEAARADLIKELNSLGVEPVGFGGFKVSTETLTQVRDILAADPANAHASR
jgi:hypothetical protein